MRAKISNANYVQYTKQSLPFMEFLPLNPAEAALQRLLS